MDWLKRMIHALTLSALLGLCAACRTSSFAAPLSFQRLCGLEVEQMGQMDEAQVRQWLEQQYGPVNRDSDLGEGVIRLWAPEKNGAAPTAFLRRDRLFKVLQSLKDGPPFGQVVAEFGAPQSVAGSYLPYETIRYEIGLDYPQLGLTLYYDGEDTSQSLTHNGRLGVQMKSDYAVDLVSCYTPRASMQQVIQNGFPSDAKSVGLILGRRQPWPGFGGWVSLLP